MRSELNAEESLVAFNAHKDLLHKQVLRKNGYKFSGNKNRVRERNDLDKVYHRWTSQKPLVKYYTCGRQVNTQRDVLTEISPYTLPASSWYRLKEDKPAQPNDPKIKNYQKLTQRGKDSADLLSRVYIAPDNKPLPLGITDFNPDYFSLVKGRGIARRFSKFSYLNAMRTTLQQNIMTAIYRDKTKLVNQQFLLNFKMISSLYDSLYDVEETLKAFSYYDENETLKVKNTQKMFWRMYSENSEIIESVKRKTASILNDVQYNWDRLLTRIHCKKLLYEISPPSWKKWYDQKKSVWKPEDMESYNALNKHYNDYVNAAGMPDPEIAKIMEDCRNIYTSLGPNDIYYSHMSQVEDVFKDLEGQATLALEYTALISNLREKLLKLLDQTEKYYSQENSILDNLIELLGKKIEDNNRRANDLEIRLNMKASTWFKETIIGQETLMVKSLIQCLYDEIVGQRNRLMTNKDMMEQLEAKMIRLRTDIEQIDRKERREMSESLKKREEHGLLKAEEAKFKETRLKKLLRQMENSMREMPKRTWKSLKPRSQPKDEPDIRIGQMPSSRTVTTKRSAYQGMQGVNDEDEWDCMSYDSKLKAGMEKGCSIRLTELIDM